MGELCDTLGASPEEIGLRILRSADRVLANSQATAAWLRDLREAMGPPEPQGGVDAVAYYLLTFAIDRKRLLAMGLRGRSQVEATYGRAAQRGALNRLMTLDKKH